MAYLEFLPTKPLYHYTSKDGFMGIIKSRNLWASDLSSSNDPRDVNLGIDTVKQILREIGNKEYPNTPLNVLSNLSRKLAGYFAEARCYMACFTPHNDDINMWREYGNDGEGYSIGFRPRAVTDMHGRIYSVRYIDDSSYSDLYNLVSEVVKPIEIYGESIFNDAEMEIGIGTALISIVNSLKHHSWKYEDEIRLTFASGDEPPPLKMPVSVSLDGKEKHWKKFQIRQSGGRSIKYHALSFGKYGLEGHDAREAIFEIVSGPNATLDEADIRQILVDNG